MSDTPRTDAFALEGAGHMFEQGDFDFCSRLERELNQATATLAAANARIAELESDAEWRPIETAPKDGTVIRVKLSKGRTLFAAWRRVFLVGKGWFVEVPPIDGSTSGAETLLTHADDQPTHWKPQSRSSVTVADSTSHNGANNTKQD